MTSKPALSIVSAESSRSKNSSSTIKITGVKRVITSSARAKRVEDVLFRFDAQWLDRRSTRPG
jgi:hypothetical protein